MGNTFGKLFTVTTFGESHGGGVGVVIDGCPPGLMLAAADIQSELDRRRPGQSPLSTQRKEADQVEILSGVYQGRTLGTPIALLVRNADARPEAYDEIRDTFRPSHADYTYEAKFGLRNPEGGGRASARETIGRVAAGAVAKKLLSSVGISIRSYVAQIYDIALPRDWSKMPTPEEIEANFVRCPDPETAQAMQRAIEKVRNEGDSVGGIVRTHILGIPAGLGEPVFDRLHADLAKAMLSIPAAKGFQIGSGFAGCRLKGSEHNDLFYCENGKIRTRTNRSGGVQGGISNGEQIDFETAFKPTATIFKPQETVNREGQPHTLVCRGRHDPCVVPRAVPIADAMAALVIADHWMRQKALRNSFSFDK